MPARAALLALLAAVGVALARLPVDPPRPPDAPRLPEPRAPTRAEFDAAQAAVWAAGGGMTWERDTGMTPSQYPNLPTISLGGTLTAERIDRLPDPGFDHYMHVVIDPTTPPGLLARLARFRNLRMLSLDIRDRADEGPFHRSDTPPSYAAARVAELAAVPHLERLYLGRGTNEPRFGDDVAAVLPAFPALRSVTGLTDITDTGAATLARIDRLERLIVGGPRLTDAGLERLSALPNLRDLDVRNRPPLTAAALRPFTFRPRLTRLHTMTLLDGMGAVEEIARIHTLEYLSVAVPKSEADGRRDIRPLARLPRLRVFSSGDYCSDDDAELLASFPALEYVVLRLGTDAGVRHLTRIRTLRKLWLWSPAVTDAGLAEVAALPRLESLWLNAGPGITDDGLDALAAAPRLAELGLHSGVKSGGLAVSEAGLRRFVAARGPGLSGLSVTRVGVGDDFVTFVAAKAPNLRRLDLSWDGGITDRSVPALRTLPRLRSLRLGGSSGRQPALRALEYEVEGIRVVTNPR